MNIVPSRNVVFPMKIDVPINYVGHFDENPRDSSFSYFVSDLNSGQIEVYW